MFDQERNISDTYASWGFINADPCGFYKNIDPCEVFACCHGSPFDFFEEDDVHSVTAPSTTQTDQNKSASSFRTDDDLDLELENLKIEDDDDCADDNDDCIYSPVENPEQQLPEVVVQDRLQAITAQRKKNENNRLLRERGQQVEGLACTVSALNENAANYAACARVLKEKCKNKNNSSISLIPRLQRLRRNNGSKSKIV
jgi:hypothetical protein